MTQSSHKTHHALSEYWKVLLGTDLRKHFVEKETPAVFYAAEPISINMKVYESVAPHVVKQFRYAMKACALAPVVRQVASAGWGADCQSRMEAELALRCGIDSSKISICGPRLSEEDIAWCLNNGIRVIADSQSQLRIVNEHLSASTVHSGWQLGVRISLPVEGTVRFHSKLGIDPETVIASLKEMPALIPYLNEIHHHGAARETDSNLATDVARVMAHKIVEIEGLTGACFSQINLGGGFEPESVINEFGSSTKEIFDSIVSEMSNHFSFDSRQLVLEPGRAIVKDAAIGLTTVNHVKKLWNTDIAVVDIATNLFIPLPLARFQALCLNERGGTVKEYDVVDGTCSPAGVLCRATFLPELNEGDRLLIDHAGAYTWSLAEPFYDYLPDLWWISSNGKVEQILSREQAKKWVDIVWGYSTVT